MAGRSPRLLAFFADGVAFTAIPLANRQRVT